MTSLLNELKKYILLTKPEPLNPIIIGLARNNLTFIDNSGIAKFPLSGETFFHYKINNKTSLIKIILIHTLIQELL